jgi:hypothetical protein
MRKSLWIALVLLLVAISTPNAHADSYVSGNIQFTVTGGTMPVAPTGSFVYDASTNLFQTISVTYQGVIGFDLAPCANGYVNTGGTIYCQSTSDPLTSYLALSSCSDGGTSTCTWFTAVCGFSPDCVDAFSYLASGPWIVAEINIDAAPFGHTGENAFGTFTTPEPGSLLLLGSGLLGLVGLFHRKFCTSAVA